MSQTSSRRKKPSRWKSINTHTHTHTHRTSLTKRQQNLLKYACEQAEDYEIIHFVFADVNGNLKLRLKEKVRNRMVFSFNNKTELAEILGIIKHFEYSKLSQLIQQQRENSNGSDIDEF